jgi:hypothetical protein
MKYWLNESKKQIVKLYNQALECKVDKVHSIIKPYWIVEHINLIALKVRLYYFLAKDQALNFIRSIIHPKRNQIEKKLKSHDSTITSIIGIATLALTILALR